MLTGKLFLSRDFLKYFKELTLEISTEKSISISKTVVCSRALLKHCAYLYRQLYDSPEISNIICTLKKQVELRFGSLEKIQIYAEATILDPRFEKYGF